MREIKNKLIFLMVPFGRAFKFKIGNELATLNI